MPCVSDWIIDERDQQCYRTAKLLVFACNELGLEVKPEWAEMAKSVYECWPKRDYTPELCFILRSLPTEDLDKAVYNARSKESRDLADWWEYHVELDRKRELKEAEERKKEELRQSVIQKLTPEELAAVLEPKPEPYTPIKKLPKKLSFK